MRGSSTEPLAAASRSGPSTTDHHAAPVADDTVDDDFTIRAVLAGLLIGCLLAFTNLYLGLQSGWISMMSLQSSLLGFALFRILPRHLDLAGRRFVLMSSPFTPQENVLVQTTAAAVGVMPLSAGLVGVIPALKKLTWEKDGSDPIDLDFVHLVGWCFALAYFGVFFASPLREPMIVKEKLTFPSGTATAQLIGVLHNKPLIGQKTSTADVGDASIRRRRGYSDDAEVGAANERTALLSEQDRSDADLDSQQEGHQDSIDSSKGWKALAWSFSGSAGFTILSYYIPVLYAMPLFDFIPPHNLASMWGFWFTPSLNYIGQGIIMGLPTTVSMTAGAIVGWAVLSPLAYFRGWAPGHPLDSDEGSKGWILWISLAIMCSESIVGLVALVASNGIRDLKSLAAKKKQGRQQGSDDQGHGDADADAQEEADEDHEPPARQTPKAWVIAGLLGSTLIAVVLIYISFGAEGISLWATLLGIVLASLFAILGVRALGETDLNPVSGIGKISQLIFALVQPGNVVANLIAGGISEAGAMQAGDLMQDYKTGHLVGASPRSQFKGQLIGSTLGILVSSFAYKLYTNAYEIPGPQFPAPTAAVWLNLARLVNHGHLPDKVNVFMIVFGAIFAVTGVIKTLARSKALHEEGQVGTSAAAKVAKLVPSGIAFAVGMLNTPNFSLTRLVGGLVAHWYHSRQRASASGQRSKSSSALAGIGIIIVASGFVLGEGAASIVTLLLKQNGAQAWTCAGCRGGCAGGCS
ncbi:Oligopeptide transporter, OPT superfamily [Kalmanozyma brasiliensis GHG001]|uniref:Oligopeptide transporter, OPT superfamily n=1 Tax=Kalmanozyma brasiliensis (strain GHG001) TaxID=1365824 RepID=UPI002867B1C8|nr:Oligopeptide transporter, OPT superfamily [Kalmanozyma brasiliensis GHG001]KAF6767482.1 Oligopeptide transporter, OPT superfamily [Kalmanozyma brasiliensis GHG001]